MTSCVSLFLVIAQPFAKKTDNSETVTCISGNTESTYKRVADDVL